MTSPAPQQSEEASTTGKFPESDTNSGLKGQYLLRDAVPKGRPNRQQDGYVQLELQRERHQSCQVRARRGNRPVSSHTATGTATNPSASEGSKPRRRVRRDRALVVALEEGGEPKGVGCVRPGVWL